MKTDKEMMLAFQEQFNTGRLFTESQVLVLMGYARGEERKRPTTGNIQLINNPCANCGVGGSFSEENCKTCNVLR